MMPELDDEAWLDWAKATGRSAVGVFMAKLIAVILLAQFWLIPMQIRLLWGFLPTTAFFTSGSQVRSLATWSTTLTALAAVLWTLLALVRQHRARPAETLGAFMTVPMALLLATLEWFREVGGHHLIETSWLWRIIAGLAAASVLFAGFWDHRGSTADPTPTPEKESTSYQRRTPTQIHPTP